MGKPNEEAGEESLEPAFFHFATWEGAEVRLAVDGDDLDEQDRKELHAAIEAGERELDLGHGVAEDELWARLRAIP